MVKTQKCEGKTKALKHMFFTWSRTLSHLTSLLNEQRNSGMCYSIDTTSVNWRHLQFVPWFQLEAGVPLQKCVYMRCIPSYPNSMHRPSWFLPEHYYIFYVFPPNDRVSRGYLVLEFLVSRVRRWAVCKVLACRRRCPDSPVIQRHPRQFFPFRRASAACASRPKSEADLQASKCQMVRYEARMVNQVLRVHLDLRDLELRANR